MTSVLNLHLATANILREKPANLFPVKYLTADCVFEVKIKNRLPDSLVVEGWHRVGEVPGSIPSQGPRHTKDAIKMAPVVPLFSSQH